MRHAVDESTSSPESYLNPRCTPELLDSFIQRRSILEALRRQAPGFSGTLLDVGCGSMPYKAVVLAPPSRVTRYIGLDLKDTPFSPPPDMLWDGRRIPLPDNALECAIATEVFEHCPEPEAVMGETRRVLKPGGLLFFTVPFCWPLHNQPYDEYRYTPFSLERHLANAGFAEIRIEALGGWDASLAQLLGLWVRRRPMSSFKHAVLSRLAMPVIRFLVSRDQPPDSFHHYVMITGLSGTARKPAS